MNFFDKNNLFEFAVIGSTVAGLYFLVTGFTSDFDSNYIKLSIVFFSNTLIFSSMKK